MINKKHAKAYCCTFHNNAETQFFLFFIFDAALFLNTLSYLIANFVGPWLIGFPTHQKNPFLKAKMSTATTFYHLSISKLTKWMSVT